VIDDLATAGTETQLLALLRLLDRSRVCPYLVLLRGTSATSRALEPEDCPVLRLQVGSLCRLATLGTAWTFRCWLRRERIDVVQAYFPDSSYFALPMACVAGVRHRVRIRNNLGHWLTPLHRIFGRLLQVFVTRSLTNCDCGKEHLQGQGISAEQISVLPNGVDLDRFTILKPPQVCPEKVRKVGVVANLRQVKGLDVLITAAAHLQARFPKVHFEVAGEGEMRPQLEQAIAKGGLSQRFRLPGLLHDIPAFLESLDVAVLCSRSEGMSNALLEYMAAARPIVATSVGAAPQMLTSGVHGLLVPPNDPLSLAQALEQLLSQPLEARRIGLAARQRAIAEYSRQAMVQRFDEFYQSLQEES
jgi:glycosyltransferase involved in cell wall biosynthesis